MYKIVICDDDKNFIQELEEVIKECNKSKRKYKFSDKTDYKFNMKRQYVIWAWKADYLNLGAGCEMGFYNTYGSTKHYFFVKKIFTELDMKYNGVIINEYTPSPSKGGKKRHSWNF